MDDPSGVLVAEYLAGNDQALDQLVHLHFLPLYNFVFLIVPDAAVAEDVVQETLIKAWRSLGRFDQRQKFKTWLYTIAKHTAFDWIKKKRPIPFAALTDDTELENLSDGQPEPLTVLSHEEMVARLEQSLTQLPILYRTLLTLVYREDFSLHEAATVLGQPYNTVKSQHQRGVAKLKQLMHASKPSSGPY